MKKCIVFVLSMFVWIGNISCQSTYFKLSPKDFQTFKEESPASQLIDVRTPNEFQNGHIEGALNIDISAPDFQNRMLSLDKSKPVLVYCLSGGRSGRAYEFLKTQNFKNVFDLDGGMMKWRAANLPETKSQKSDKLGLTIEQFEDLLKTDKTVLIDFYAEWCAPCKKMKPYLDEISEDRKADVLVVRIDADANKELCKIKKVDALPVVQIYKNGKLTWENQGFVDKKEVLSHL